jgi:hypothetical protein
MCRVQTFILPRFSSSEYMIVILNIFLVLYQCDFIYESRSLKQMNNLGFLCLCKMLTRLSSVFDCTLFTFFEQGCLDLFVDQ